MIRTMKYFTPIFLYLLALVAFSSNGFYCWLALIYAWILIPVAELS